MTRPLLALAALLLLLPGCGEEPASAEPETPEMAEPAPAEAAEPAEPPASAEETNAKESPFTLETRDDGFDAPADGAPPPHRRHAHVPRRASWAAVALLLMVGAFRSAAAQESADAVLATHRRTREALAAPTTPAASTTPAADGAQPVDSARGS